LAARRATERARGHSGRRQGPATVRRCPALFGGRPHGASPGDSGGAGTARLAANDAATAGGRRGSLPYRDSGFFSVAGILATAWMSLPLTPSPTGEEGDMNMDNAKERPVIVGWQEEIDFPDWGFRRIPAKIDTGARTSALDVVSYTLSHEEGEGLIAELRLALRRRRPQRIKTVRARVMRMVVVCNSSGMREQRPLIETTLRLGPITKTVQLTVTNRFNMRFPVILGRQALADDFLVDVSRKNILKNS